MDGRYLQAESAKVWDPQDTARQRVTRPPASRKPPHVRRSDRMVAGG
jgi:hypothetical protein